MKDTLKNTTLEINTLEAVPRKRLDCITKRTNDTSVTSDLGPWLPTPKFEYRHTFFNEPRNFSSDKENVPPPLELICP